MNIVLRVFANRSQADDTRRTGFDFRKDPADLLKGNGLDGAWVRPDIGVTVHPKRKSNGQSGAARGPADNIQAIGAYDNFNAGLTNIFPAIINTVTADGSFPQVCFSYFWGYVIVIT